MFEVFLLTVTKMFLNSPWYCFWYVAGMAAAHFRCTRVISTPAQKYTVLTNTTQYIPPAASYQPLLTRLFGHMSG